AASTPVVLRLSLHDALPILGLYASFVMSIIIAVFGGRPAMITAAAGSVALVAAPLIASHGLPYLFAAGLLAGLVQIAFGLLRMRSEEHTSELQSRENLVCRL